MDWHPGGLGSSVYPVILLIVLSVHSVILGLALGAQSALSGALIVFLAIVAHKGAAGVALGVGYQRAGLTHRHALPKLAFFSAMTPLGIVAGASIGAVLTGRADVLFEAVFDSIGAGTFIYIAALDIIKTEFDSQRYHHRSGWWPPSGSASWRSWRSGSEPFARRSHHPSPPGPSKHGARLKGSRGGRAGRRRPEGWQARDLDRAMSPLVMPTE